MDETALLALRASGWIAAIALLGAIAASPIARLVPRTAGRIGRVRRALGITAGSVAIGHALVALATYLEPGDRWASIASIAWLRSGALALAVLVPLLLTSFPGPTRILRVRAWKPLHRLAYPAILLVLHHLVLGPFAPRSWLVAMTVLVGLALAARLLPRRDRIVADPEVET